MHRTLLGGAFALCLTLGGGAHAQDAPDRARLSLAAGYKAAFLCSGLFNAGLDGGTRRAIDLREGDRIDEAAFRALIRAAVALNTAPKPVRLKS